MKNSNTTMGAIKDIYDILSEVTAKVQAHRRKKSKERSREDLESYANELETSVEELRVNVQVLEREHTAAVAALQVENAKLVAQIEKLKKPCKPPTSTRSKPQSFM
jgi:hypothetical protein